jgi:hypothetical protein
MTHRVCTWMRAAVWGCIVALAPCAASAQTQADATPQAAGAEHKGAHGVFKFLGGAALGLATHESGHVALDVALGTDPYLKKVDFSGIPFVAITYRRPVSRRATFAIASAGFWVQDGLSEWLLTRSPDVRLKCSPAAKGFLAFHVGTSLAYAGAAFAHAGPPERDTSGMARSLRVDERWVGVALLAPATLDVYRYYRPRSRWAPWASRAAKLTLVLLVVR